MNEQLPIEQYAFVGDRHTGAVIGATGSVDWLCLPRFDSAAAFAALLGDPSNGRWLIGPVRPATTTRRYRPGTLLLETTHETPEGVVRVIDAMPTGAHRADVIRRVEGVSGTVRLRHEWVARFSYGKVVPWVKHVGDVLQAVAGPDMLVLRGPRLPHPEGLKHVDELVVAAGDRLDFEMTWTPAWHDVPEPLDIDAALAETEAESCEWLTGSTYEGPYENAVTTSLLVLRALSHHDTGGIVAAPTTSLPETMGGGRNWDYRFTWLRDAALTVEAALMVGMPEKALMWRDWLLRAVAGSPEDLQIMYGVDGTRELPERELDHLAGYAGSRPVRVGNGAVDQVQLDVLGQVMIALETLRDQGLETEDAWKMQRALVNDLALHWEEKDHGLWEMRGDTQHFTHSRVMVWVAFDRAVRAVREGRCDGDAESWTRIRDAVREEILTRGFDEETGSFTQHYDTTEVDASLLLLPVVGFIEATDPRFVGTVARIEQDLLRDGLLLRYRTEAGFDGLEGDEHPFLLCCFWLVTAYALMGRTDDAHALMDRLVGLTNDVGLMAEEYDPERRTMMGNFPQAFSHLGLIQAAVALSGVPMRPGGLADSAASRP